MAHDSSREQGAFISTEPAGSLVVRIGWILAILSGMLFLVAVPFARVPSVEAPVFIPIYVSCLILCDLITSVVLFSQFRFLRTWSLLILASGYLFTATVTAAYSLIFPGMFAPTGLLGSGPQTSSALYMFWHGGYPLMVIGYSVAKGGESGNRRERGGFRGKPRVGIVLAGLSVLAVVVGFTFFATAGSAALPVFLEGNQTTVVGHIFLSLVWLMSLAALIVLWIRRPHTVLDIWLMVVMAVWLFDLALSALLNSGRYDVGWYVGRIYGLLASSFLLMFLLVENGLHYGRLFQLTMELNAANEALERLSLHDGLTELANRRFFDRHLAEQYAIARRFNRPLSLVLFDVDHFKSFNDRYGHQAGDDCLKRMSAILAACSHRPTDLAARYGGEEFAMILPDTDATGSRKIAETVREAVENLRIPHIGSQTGLSVTVSGGVVTLRPTEEASPRQLISSADQALYQAKSSGRNRICCFGLEKL